METNYRYIATQIGDSLKYVSTVNEIDRVGKALLAGISKEDFPNPSITSVRAQAVYNWILSLAKASMNAEKRDLLLRDFCFEIATSDEAKRKITEILDKGGMLVSILYRESYGEFFNRNFHAQVVTHSKSLFLQGNYFHAIFEASKAYNSEVKTKARSTKDGKDLMLSVWGCEGVLKVTTCQTDTDRNIQDGIKFLSGGLMSAIRNPTAHEPAITLPIGKQDCLDILSFISYLFRQLDKATYFQSKI